MRKLCEKYFSEIEDTRCQCDVDHKLIDILIIVMCSILSGLDKLRDIVTYGKEKSDFLEKNFNVTKFPSEPTLSRVMNMVNADVLAEKTIRIMSELLGDDREFIAIDGKTIRSTAKSESSREKLHIITAYMRENGVTLGQLAVNEKTNEIPVLRDLLDIIDIKGKIITADAMHCQKETVEKIIENGGDYVIGLKGNQESLFNEVDFHVNDCILNETAELETAQTSEKNKDRYEERTCYKVSSLDWLSIKDDWAGLKTVFAINRNVVTKQGETDEVNFYISSLDVSAEKFLEIVRGHWAIESMHYVLDVTFSEDCCRIFNTNGQKSLNIFRKLAIALHKNYINKLPQKTKPSIKNNLLKTLISDSLLLNIIKFAL